MALHIFALRSIGAKRHVVLTGCPCLVASSSPTWDDTWRLRSRSARNVAPQRAQRNGCSTFPSPATRDTER